MPGIDAATREILAKCTKDLEMETEGMKNGTVTVPTNPRPDWWNVADDMQRVLAPSPLRFHESSLWHREEHERYSKVRGHFLSKPHRLLVVANLEQAYSLFTGLVKDEDKFDYYEKCWERYIVPYLRGRLMDVDDMRFSAKMFLKYSLMRAMILPVEFMSEHMKKAEEVLKGTYMVDDGMAEVNSMDYDDWKANVLLYPDLLYAAVDHEVVRIQARIPILLESKCIEPIQITADWQGIADEYRSYLTAHNGEVSDCEWKLAKDNDAGN
ncbi:MAG: hypothetical protein Q9212_004922 [Teloschistes hypoglaucus]